MVSLFWIFTLFIRRIKDFFQHHWKKSNEGQHKAKPTIRLVEPAKTQISLRIYTVWSVFADCMCLYSLQAIQRGLNENPYHIGWMYRLNWVFAGHTGLIVGFAVRWLIYRSDNARKCTLTHVPASVAQLDAPSDWRPGGRGFNTRRGRQHSFVEIDREIFSMVILSLLLIQEGQLSVFWRKNVHNTV